MVKYSSILRNQLNICAVYEFNKVAGYKINIQKRKINGISYTLAMSNPK